MSHRVEQRRFKPLTPLDRFSFTSAIKGFTQLFVETFYLDLTGLRFLSTSLCSRRKLADSKRRNEKRCQRNPILRIGNGKGVKWREEEKVETQHSENRS